MNSDLKLCYNGQEYKKYHVKHNSVYFMVSVVRWAFLAMLWAGLCLLLQCIGNNIDSMRVRDGVILVVGVSGGVFLLAVYTVLKIIQENFSCKKIFNE